jgi:hypothetical protein
MADSFRNATSEIIGVAYLNLGHRFRMDAHELRNINALLSQLKDRIIKNYSAIPDDLWFDEMTEFKEASDELTDTMVENGQLVAQLVTAIKFYSKQNGITTTTTKSKGV